MESYDNRRYSRYSCQAAIMIYPDEYPEKYHYGLSYNYSNRGMYIKTDGDLNPYYNYVIKMLNYDENMGGPEKYNEYNVSIRWVQSHQSGMYSDSNYYYGYGVEYIESVDYYE